MSDTTRKRPRSSWFIQQDAQNLPERLFSLVIRATPQDSGPSSEESRTKTLDMSTAEVPTLARRVLSFLPLLAGLAFLGLSILTGWSMVVAAVIASALAAVTAVLAIRVNRSRPRSQVPVRIPTPLSVDDFLPENQVLVIAASQHLVGRPGNDFASFVLAVHRRDESVRNSQPEASRAQVDLEIAEYLERVVPTPVEEVTRDAAPKKRRLDPEAARRYTEDS